MAKEGELDGHRFSFIVTDEKDEPLAGFETLPDVKWFVEIVCESEDFIPKVYEDVRGEYQLTWI